MFAYHSLRFAQGKWKISTHLAGCQARHQGNGGELIIQVGLTHHNGCPAKVRDVLVVQIIQGFLVRSSDNNQVVAVGVPLLDDLGFLLTNLEGGMNGLRELVTGAEILPSDDVELVWVLYLGHVLFLSIIPSCVARSFADRSGVKPTRAAPQGLSSFPIQYSHGELNPDPKAENLVNLPLFDGSLWRTYRIRPGHGFLPMPRSTLPRACASSTWVRTLSNATLRRGD